MKSVIARKTILPVLFTFLVLLGILFAFNYRYINNLITTDKNSELGQLSEYMLDQVKKINAEDDLSYIKAFKDLSLQICSSFDVDYICLFEPNLSNGTISYKAITYSPQYGKDTAYTDSILLNGPVEYALGDNEIEVLNGNSDICFTKYRNRYDFSLSSLISVELPSGARNLVTIEKEISAVNHTINRVVRIQAEYILFVFILVCAIFYIVIRKYVSEPAGLISNAMDSFTSKGHGNFTKMDESRNDEFGLINRSFNKMASDLDKYVDNLSKQKAEIDIASKIQKGLLPNEKSFYNGFRMRAMMTPAKDIGGDLYDYLELDDQNTLVTIADVSGKGVSAAVFMAATLMELRQFARLKMSPKEILKNANEELINKNPLMLFVTAFVAIYNKQNKTLTYSNAGHNYPYVVSNGKIKMLDQAKGTVIGLFEDETYEEEVIKLLPGETLFMYTDGVNEAVNGKQEFFGLDNLEKALQSYSSAYGHSLVRYISSKLEEFSENTEQNDDITMLTLTAEDQITVNLKPQTSDFEIIKNTILSADVPAECKLPLCLASEEIFVNICSYAFKDIETEKQIAFSLRTSDRIEISFEDNGIPYDPTQSNLTDLDTYDTELQTGGLGKAIAFSIADKVIYEYKNGKNILIFYKYKGLNL